MNRFCLTALLWLVFAVHDFAAVSADDLCPICGKRFSAISTKVYGFTKRGREEKVFVCAECAKLETTCYICGLPVRDKFMKLADGRLLCDEDAKQVVLEQAEAENIFEDVKRDAQAILAQLGALPHQNIHLILEARARLDKTGSNLISAHDDRLLMGLTRSTGRGAGEIEHTIYLLHGLTRERMVVVAAHEYGHAWLHENVRRKLNHSTVEGFCDWLAWKVIKEKSAPYELKVLLDSKYSEGQLQAFLAAENEQTFHRVMQWVKGGVDPEIDPEHLERILELREKTAAPAPSLAFATPVPPRAAPTNLVLKGLSGPKTRRFALINDGTFELNEQGKLRLGESNVVVHCLQIQDNAVVIQVAGENGTRTLSLNAAR